MLPARRAASRPLGRHHVYVVHTYERRACTAYRLCTAQALLDQYRDLLLAANRRDLVGIINRYRNAVTSALHAMKRGGGGGGSGGAGSRGGMVQAALRGSSPF